MVAINISLKFTGIDKKDKIRRCQSLKHPEFKAKIVIAHAIDKDIHCLSK
jgi:hypothetical protein